MRPVGMIGINGLLSKVVIAVILAALLLAMMGCHSDLGGQDSDGHSADQIMMPSDNGVESNQGIDSAAQEKRVQAAQEAIASLVESYGDQVAVTVILADGTGGFDINGDKRFVSASMIKLLVLSEYLTQVSDGNLSESKEYVLADADIVGGASHISEQGAGAVFTYDQLAEAMIAYSDNTATNILIKKLGMDNINKKAEELGLGQTDLQRLMMDTESGLENHMSTNDAAKILLSIVNNKVATPQLCDRAEHYLASQTDNLALSVGLPDDVGFAHKTGSLGDVRHDGGVVCVEDPYVIVVFTELGSDAGDQVMRIISAAVYEALES